MKKYVLIAAALAMTATSHGEAFAAQSFSGRLSTTVEWFDNPEGDQAIPVYLNGFLNVREIADVPGLNFRGYGRLADDLTNEVDRKSRLYYAYIEKKKIADLLDARLGRQFVASAAGAAVIDGLDLETRKFGFVKVGAFGGVRVAQEEEYKAGDMALGFSARAEFGLDGDAALAYFQERDDHDLAREILGLDLRYDIENALELSGDAQYNLLMGGISRFFAEANYHRNPKYQLKVHYLYDIPVFRATSIYSVFAVDQYQEAGADFIYVLDKGLNAVARYTREIYESTADANVYEVGVEKLPFGAPWSGYLLGTYRDDKDGQDLRGAKLRLSYEYSRYFQPGFGIHYDVLERRLEDNDKTTSNRIWIFAESDLNDVLTLEAKVERAHSALYDDDYSGRVRLSYRF